MADYRFHKSLEIARALFKNKDNRNFSHRCNHYSIIFNKTRVIAIGQNNTKSNPVNLLNLPKNADERFITVKGSCSEYTAFSLLKNRTNVQTKNCIMVNVRIDNNGELRNSHPCKSCVNLIKYLNFRKVFYTNALGEFTEYRA